MFAIGFLSELWRDVLASLGAAGTLASVAGLVYAIYQIRKTKSAAEAARVASEETRTLSRQDYQRYAVANAVQFIGELKAFVAGKVWERASLRFSDLAVQASQVANLQRPNDPETANQWEILADELRQWAQSCEKVLAGQIKFQQGKWTKLLPRLESMFHTYHGPFSLDDRGEKR